MLNDLRFGIRSLIRERGFTLTAILTLAVCIAANTATFAIVHAVLLRPLPAPESNSIVVMGNQYPRAGAVDTFYSSGGDYYDRLKAVTALDPQAMFNTGRPTLDANGTPEQIVSMYATPSLFTLLRAAPVVGRVFTTEEGESGNDQKVILSYGLWQRLFGGDRGAVGRAIRLNGRPYEVVGAMGPEFHFYDPEVRLWVPLAFTKEQKVSHHSNNWTNIGRLKPGATIEQAQAQVNALNAANLETLGALKELLINARFQTTVERLQDVMVRDVRRILYLLWGGAVFLLLIGGLNVANLAFARLNVRRRELATRLAIGASRAHLARQLIIENALLGLAGGVTGVGLGAGMLKGLTTLGLERFPRASEVGIDTQVILISLVIAALIGVVIALIPLTAILKAGLNQALRENSRTGTSGGRARAIRQTLVAAQIGFAFALLAGAGLLLASFRQLLDVKPGFRPDHLVTVSFSPPRATYKGDNELRSFMTRALNSIRQVPGVLSAGATNSIPFGGNHSDGVIFAEGYVMQPGESVISPRQITVTTGYFETMNIALLRGRYFEDRDDEHSEPAVIVDEYLARKFWPGGDPIGKRMYQPQNANMVKTDEHTKWHRVVGVVGSVRQDSLEGKGDSTGTYYFANSQQPARFATAAARIAGDAGSTVRGIRAAIARIDPELALFDIKSMDERTYLSLSSRRAAMSLAVAFGALALFLAAIGIYGVLAYLVTQRRREIGIRVALGSTAAGIVRLVFREGLVLVGFGLALGIAGAVALKNAVATQLYGVSPLDARVLGGVVAILAAVAVTACIIPAGRAAKVDPVIVLSEQ